MGGDFKNEKRRSKPRFKTNEQTKKKLFRQKVRTVVTEPENEEIERLKNQYSSIETSKIERFKNFPLSRRTLEGLQNASYEKPTEIQREAIGLALRGLDILGAAKTGSGKTLAFIVPVLEKLFTNLWTKEDGLGALIITPTRELAYQIFETLRKVGRKHDFSAGLIIGGKDLKFERKRMQDVNIIICTPGRLLQHMDENPNLNCYNLQILVLDEADRCLDLGFEDTMNSIITNLPVERQTLLFSATQTKSVKDLARLSLKSPVYVSVHENAKFCTPETLQQSYMVCPLESKLNMLWSFIKHHKKKKILVFMTCCKQVRFVNMLFCRMRPGISLLALYGSLHQLKRMAVYEEFCKKQAVCMFATDIAARGLDFPSVDWVVQLDCPEDVTTYIHRVGRTARYNKDGESILVLLPSEKEGMLKELEDKNIPIEKLEANPNKLLSVSRKFEALLARDMTLKDCAQRAFKTYLKSVFLMKNKSVFDVNQLDLPTFARSLGLAVAPRVRFLQNKVKSEASVVKEEPDSDGEKDEKNFAMPSAQNKKPPTTFDFHLDDDGSDAEDLFIGKKEIEYPEGDDEEVEDVLVNETVNTAVKSKRPKTKAQVAKKLIKKNIQANKKTMFDEEGSAIHDLRHERQSDLAKRYEEEDASGIDIDKAKAILQLEDEVDKKLFRERIRTKHREDRRKAKLLRKGATNNADDEEEFNDNYDNEPTTSLGKRKRNADNDSDSSEYEPDMSWLPDPDKIYGKEQDGDFSNLDNDSGDDSDTFIPRRPMIGKKGKVCVSSDSDSDKEASVRRSIPAKKKGSKSFLEGNISKSLMEDLALQLLSK